MWRTGLMGLRRPLCEAGCAIQRQDKTDNADGDERRDNIFSHGFDFSFP
jgi:hypothetical protein